VRDSLQLFGNPVGKIALQPASKLLEQRNASVAGVVRSFIVGEPDEVFEMHGNQLALVGIGELHFEPYAPHLKRSTNRTTSLKQAGIAQALGRFPEIAVGGVLADLQAARGKNFLVVVARRSRGLSALVSLLAAAAELLPRAGGFWAAGR